jgi:hypothetical protein
MLKNINKRLKNDEYLQNYLSKIHLAEDDDEILYILNNIYIDGFQDGANTVND